MAVLRLIPLMGVITSQDSERHDTKHVPRDIPPAYKQAHIRSLQQIGAFCILALLDDLHPGHEAVLKLGRVDARKHPANGVVRRNPVGQIAKRVEPGLLEATTFGHRDPAIGPTDDRRERNTNDVQECMVAGALLPGIIDGGTIRLNGEITEQGQTQHEDGFIMPEEAQECNN